MLIAGHRCFDSCPPTIALMECVGLVMQTPRALTDAVMGVLVTCLTALPRRCTAVLLTGTSPTRCLNELHLDFLRADAARDGSVPFGATHDHPLFVQFKVLQGQLLLLAPFGWH